MLAYDPHARGRARGAGDFLTGDAAEWRRHLDAGEIVVGASPRTPGVRHGRLVLSLSALAPGRHHSFAAQRPMTRPAPVAGPASPNRMRPGGPRGGP
jgi:hypothetical protein